MALFFPDEVGTNGNLFERRWFDGCSIHRTIPSSVGRMRVISAFVQQLQRTSLDVRAQLGRRLDFG